MLFTVDISICAFPQELTRVSKVLEVRETRLVDMSKENIQLQELNQELQR